MKFYQVLWNLQKLKPKLMTICYHALVAHPKEKLWTIFFGYLAHPRCHCHKTWVLLSIRLTLAAIFYNLIALQGTKYTMFRPFHLLFKKFSKSFPIFLVVLALPRVCLLPSFWFLEKWETPWHMYITYLLAWNGAALLHLLYYSLHS